MSGPTLTDAVRSLARGLAYEETAVTLDCREGFMEHPLADAHNTVARRLIRQAREQFEEAFLAGVDLSVPAERGANLRARGEELAHAIECSTTLIGIRDYLDEQVQFARDLRGDHDSPRSYAGVA